MNGDRSIKSDYMQYLPAILQADPFLEQFLLAFEQILSGLSNPSKAKILQTNPTHSPELEALLAQAGLEALIAQSHIYFDPKETPAEFLPWLASWVALSLREDWSEPVKRNFIRSIVPLYRIRGTKEGLIKMLQLYLENGQEKVEVYEFDRPAHYFQVELKLASQDLVAYRRKERIARAIIDQEKPAHTFYALQIRMPTMRLISYERAEAEAKAEGTNPLKKMLRIGNRKDHNNTILGTDSSQALDIK